MANQSGISVSVPTLLAYPSILSLKDVPEIRNEFIYIIEAYTLNGLTVLITRQQVKDHIEVSIKFGDWDGNAINPTIKDANSFWVKKFMEEYSTKFLALMQSIRLPQAQFYFTIINNDLYLTDTRQSLNKFTGPGMIKDIFGRIVNIQQEVGKPTMLDPELYNKIQKGIKPYDKKLILKTSAFKTITRAKALLPLYALVR